MNLCIKCDHEISPRLLSCSNVSYCNRRVQAQRQDAEEVLASRPTVTTVAERRAMLKSIGDNLGMPFVFEDDLEVQEMGFANDEVRQINEELGFIEPRKDK